MFVTYSQKGGVVRPLVLLILCLSFVGLAAEPPPIPAFTDPPKYLGVKISPGGTYVAASLYVDGEARFRVWELTTDDIKFSFGMGDKRRISDFWWVSDDIVVVTPSQRVPGSDFYFPTGAKMALEIGSGRQTDVYFGYLLDVLPEDDKHILVMGVEGRHTEVYRMDIKSSAKEQLARAAVPGGLFVLDKNRNVVFSIGENERGDQEVHYRPGRNERWQHITTTPFGQGGWRPITFGFTEGSFLTSDNSRGTTAGLGSYNPETKERKMLLQHPVVDIGFGNLRRDYDGNTYAVEFEFHYPQMHYLNKTHPLSIHLEKIALCSVHLVATIKKLSPGLRGIGNRETITY